MEQAKVVVRKLPDSGGRVRTGTLLAQQGSSLRVRWDDDGCEEDVSLSTTTTFAERGSLRHQALVDLAAFTARLEAEPAAVVVWLLREQASAMTALQIKQKLLDVGLEAEVLDKAWKRAQRKLVKLDEVRTVNKNAYKWTGPKLETMDTQAERPAYPSAEVASDPAVPNGPSARPVADETPGEVAGETADTFDAPGEIAGHTDSSSDPAEEPSASGIVVPLTQAFATALNDAPVLTALHYAQRPLATAARLGRLDDAAIDRLLKSVDEEERAQALALLVALPRAAKPIDTPECMTAVAPATIQAILAASAAELRPRSPVGPELMSAAGWLLRRAVDLPLETQAMQPLIELTAAIAVEPGKHDLEVLEQVAHIVHRLLPMTTWDERRAVAPDVVARIASKLPFTPQGGRTALLSAAGQVWPERVIEEIWWRDVTLTDLADCASGVLGRVTARPEVAEHVITPLMLRELSKVTSRRRLADLLALPHEFVEYLPAEEVANAYRRVAEADPVVGSWVRVLAREGRVAQLEAAVERAQLETREANERAERAEARNHELAARSERLEKLLQQRHEHSVGLRVSQERQLQIDVIRGTADLAAEVEEFTASNVTREVLIERVRAILSDQNLEVVGEVGAVSAFDPESHEPLIGAPEVGESVTVLRPGYRWRSGEEIVLLSRALVSLSQS